MPGRVELARTTELLKRLWLYMEVRCIWSATVTNAF